MSATRILWGQVLLVAHDAGLPSVRTRRTRRPGTPAPRAGDGSGAREPAVRGRDPVAGAAAQPPLLGQDGQSQPQIANPFGLGGLGQPAPQSTENERRLAFLNSPVDRRTVSSDRVQAPANPYVVQAGAVIAAALITGLRSNLPGQITAQVTENIYDGPARRQLVGRSANIQPTLTVRPGFPVRVIVTRDLVLEPYRT